MNLQNIDLSNLSIDDLAKLANKVEQTRIEKIHATYDILKVCNFQGNIIEEMKKDDDILPAYETGCVRFAFEKDEYGGAGRNIVYIRKDMNELLDADFDAMTFLKKHIMMKYDSFTGSTEQFA